MRLFKSAIDFNGPTSAIAEALYRKAGENIMGDCSGEFQLVGMSDCEKEYERCRFNVDDFVRDTAIAFWRGDLLNKSDVSIHEPADGKWFIDHQLVYWMIHQAARGDDEIQVEWDGLEPLTDYQWVWVKEFIDEYKRSGKCLGKMWVEMVDCDKSSQAHCHSSASGRRFPGSWFLEATLDFQKHNLFHWYSKVKNQKMGKQTVAE